MSCGCDKPNCGCPRDPADGPIPIPERPTTDSQEHEVNTTQGGCTPVLRDPLGTCERPECGDKTIGAPQYNMVVTNPVNLLLQEDTGELIREDNNDFITVA